MRCTYAAYAQACWEHGRKIKLIELIAALAKLWQSAVSESSVKQINPATLQLGLISLPGWEQRH